MAVYFLNIKTFGRSGGSSAVSAAAYRSGERIRDERAGKTYDHSERQDVMHKEIVLPSRFADEDMAWARDRASLWNAAESAEVSAEAPPTEEVDLEAALGGGIRKAPAAVAALLEEVDVAEGGD